MPEPSSRGQAMRKTTVDVFANQFCSFVVLRHRRRFRFEHGRKLRNCHPDDFEAAYRQAAIPNALTAVQGKKQPVSGDEAKQEKFLNICMLGCRGLSVWSCFCMKLLMNHPVGRY